MKCDAVIVGLALCVAGVAYYSGCQNEDRLRALRASNDSLQASITVLNEEIYYQTLRDTSTIRAQREEIARLSRSYRSMMVATDTLLDTPILADTTQIGNIRIQIGNIRTQIDAERREAAAIIAYQDSTIQWLGTRVAFWRDTVLGERSRQLEASQALLARALAAKRPSHLVRGMLIGGAVVGVVSLLR